MNVLLSLHLATLGARNRTNDQHIGTRAEGGRVQIVRASPTTGGRFDVEPLSDWITAREAIATLNGMTGEKVP